MAAGWLIDDYHDTKKKLATDSVARARAIVSALDIEIAGIQAALTTLATSPHIGAGRFAQFHRQATQVAHSLGINNVVLVDSAFRQLVNTKVPFGNPLPHVRNALVEPVFEKGHAVTTDLFVGPLLKQSNLAPSTSEALRLVDGGGVRVDGATVVDRGLKLGAGSYVVQVGKRKFARVTLE